MQHLDRDVASHLAPQHGSLECISGIRSRLSLMGFQGRRQQETAVGTANQCINAGVLLNKAPVQGKAGAGGPKKMARPL